MSEFPHEVAGIRGYIDEVRALWGDVRRQDEDARSGRAPEPIDYPERYPRSTGTVRLVGAQHLPAHYVARAEGTALSYTTFAVYLGLSRDLVAEQGCPTSSSCSRATTRTPVGAQRSGVTGPQAGLIITDYTRVDPGCAPAGWGVVVISVAAPWDHEGVWGTSGELDEYHTSPAYLAVKERTADVLVALAADHLPGLAAAIRHREASTPLTNHWYTRNPRGAIEGYANTPENSGLGWLPNQTPIPNLLLAGAWTCSGGQVAALDSGVRAAELALHASPLGVRA